MKRILVFSPLQPEHPRIQPATLQSILAMDWPHFEVVLGREDITEPQTTEKAYANITAKYNWARMLALAGNYDALLTVESDVIVPQMALRRLASVGTDVAYGLYNSRRGQHVWLLFTNRGSYKADAPSKSPQFRKDAWGKVVESCGTGFGCTLISRKVLEAIPFRCPNPEVCCDWYFALDCQKEGFSQAHDCGVVCGHINQDKGGVVIWPDPDKGFWLEG